MTLLEPPVLTGAPHDTGLHDRVESLVSGVAGPPKGAGCDVTGL